MRTRTIILYWIILLIPTLAAGAGALVLLDHERDRLDQAEIATGLEHARAMADTVAVALNDVQTGLTRSLMAIPATERVSVLMRWTRENPLVRQGFVWEPDRGLRFPKASAHPTDAERLFALRYAPFFSGRRPWPAPNLEHPRPDSRQAGLEESGGRRALAELAMPMAAEKTSVDAVHGWMPWFSGDRLHLLGWVQSADGATVFGVELELMAVLSRLVPTLARQAGPGIVLAMEDGQGRRLYRTDGAVLDPAAVPVGRISLAPRLPHWQVAEYRTVAAPAGRQAFWIVSWLVVGAVVGIIALGGGLMAWQAIGHLRDARAKTSFVANVSHELKTPLTSIRMYAELLADGRAATEEKRQRYLRVIMDESHRLTRLVNNVLDFGRLEQGRRAFRPEPMDVAAWLDGFVQIHRLRMESAGLQVTVSRPDAPVTARVDRDALDQTLLNLVDNAIKYASDSGRIKISLVPGPVARIQVTDGGPGIPPEAVERVFQKFVRLDETLTAPQPGSGLGLTIARGLMRGHGGDVRWVADPAGGGWFEVVLPPPSHEESDHG